MQHQAFVCAAVVLALLLTCEHTIFTPSFSCHSLMKPIMTCSSNETQSLNQLHDGTK
jgi:hypothetical protein